MYPLSLIASPEVKSAPGSRPRFLILPSTQRVAFTTPLATKESPLISPAELIWKAALDDPPESVPRF